MLGGGTDAANRAHRRQIDKDFDDECRKDEQARRDFGHSIPPEDDGRDSYAGPDSVED